MSDKKSEPGSDQQFTVEQAVVLREGFELDQAEMLEEERKTAAVVVEPDSPG